MPSQKYVGVDSHGRVASFHKNIFGGSTPLLLKNVIWEVKGGALDKGKSNRVIVGTCNSRYY